MNTGEKLKEVLKAEGRTLKFVSLKTGIPYDTLSSYVRDVISIPESKLRCICLTLGIDPKIFGLDDENSSQKEAG